MPGLKITSGNYNQEINKPGILLVNFLADWCGYCQQLKPELDKLIQKLQNEKGIRVGSCDEAKNKDLIQSLGIKGFPTQKVFCSGTEQQDMTIPRDTEGMHQLLTQQNDTCR